MPYRIKKGQSVLLVSESGASRNVKFNRTVDFDKSELISSPLTEHQSEGIPTPSRYDYPWGISIRNKWVDVGDFVELYAEEIHELSKGSTYKDVNTVVVQGSGTNQYTVTLDRYGNPVECSCRGYRFKRKPCKHMRQLSATL